MAWNRPNGSEASQKCDSRSACRRGLIAGVIVFVLGVAALLYFNMPSDPQTRRQKTTTTALIKEVKPAVAAQPVTNAAPKAHDPHEGYVLSSSGVWQPTNVPWKTSWKKVHKVHTNKAFRVRKEVPYRNATEQMLLQTFNCRLGMCPRPLLRLPKKDLENLVGILSSKTPISETDSPELARAKDTLNLAKKEFMKYLKEGGKPNDFFRFYHGQLERAYNLRREALDMSRKMAAEGDHEATRAFQEKVNEKFRKEGIMAIPVEGRGSAPANEQMSKENK